MRLRGHPRGKPGRKEGKKEGKELLASIDLFAKLHSCCLLARTLVDDPSAAK